MKCTTCGREIPEGSKFCQYCGSCVTLEKTESKAPNEAAATMISALMGSGFAQKMEEAANRRDRLFEGQRTDDPDYGCSVSNPIMTSTIAQSDEYLKHLRTPDGKPFTWRRTGSRALRELHGVEDVMVDAYQLYLNGKEYKKIYICPYGHNSSSAPEGMRYASETGSENDRASAAPQTTETPVEAAPDKHHASPKKIAVISALSVCAVLVILLAVYSGTYFSAKKSAEKMDYERAVELIVCQPVTKLHDPLFSDYIDACKVLIAGDTRGAENGFRQLDDYLNADKMVCECKYISGLQSMEAGDYNFAKGTFGKLLFIDPNYKDAEQKYVDSVIAQTDTYLQEGDYYNAIIYLIENNNGKSKEITEKIEKIKDKVYSKAVNLYKAKDYDNARDYFGTIDGYKSTDKYELLLEFHKNGYESSGREYLFEKYTYTEEKYEQLLKIIDFADTKEVLVERQLVATRFLSGTWRTKDGAQYFKITKQGDQYYAKYNLPTVYVSDGYYSIENGIYSLHNDTVSKKEFKITVINADEIDVYCYKNNTTYKMYRQ